MNKRLKKFIYIVITLFTTISQSGIVPVFAETLTDDGQELVKITTDKTQYTNDETVKIEVKGEKENLDQFVLDQQANVTIQTEKRINDTQKEYIAKVSKTGSYTLSGKLLEKVITGPTIKIVDSSMNSDAIANSTTNSITDSQQSGSSTEVSTETSETTKTSDSTQATAEASKKQVRAGNYSVVIDAPTSIEVGDDLTYSVTVNSDATVDNPLSGVEITVQLPEGFELDQLADNPYVESYTYDPATNQVVIVLKDITDSVINFTLDANSVNDENKYEDMNVEASVTGNDVGNGAPATDTADTTITGDVTYSTSKAFTTVPGTGNRVVTYTFNFSGSADAGQFYTWQQKITDELPAGTEIVGNDGKFGKWEITGSKGAGWTAVWTAEKMTQPGSDLGNEKDYPSLTVYYPEDQFPSSPEDPQRPPENTSSLTVYDKNGKEYDGGQGHTQGPAMSDGASEGVGIDKRSGTSQGGGSWYDGYYNRHFQIDGSFVSATERTAREVTIEDDRDKNGNDNFWNRIDLYQLDLNFNTKMMEAAADYRFEFKTNQHTWQEGYTGNTAKNARLSFHVPESPGYAIGDARIDLAEGEYITGVRLVIGNKEDATVKIQSSSVATMDFYFFPSAENHETHTDDNDTVTYNNHATVNGYVEDGSALKEESDDFAMHFKKNVILGTKVEAPSTMNVGKDSQYTAYINNQSASYDYNNSIMKVVLPAGVYYDQAKGVSPLADKSEAPYNLDVPKPGSGVIISTETVPATSDYPYERQVVVFKFLVPIPAMRVPGAATDRFIERKGFGYTIPVNVTSEAYADNRQVAPVSSWATTSDTRFTGIAFHNYANLLHADDFNFDTNRDTIAWSEGQSQIQTQGGLLLTKLVNNQTAKSEFSTDGAAEAKDAMNWQLSLQNVLPNEVQNVQVFDRVPQQDDKNQFSTTLSGPIENLPAGATVEYSKDATDATTGTWATDWQGATAFRITIPSIAANSTIKVNVPFEIPDSVKAGDSIENTATGTGVYEGNDVTYGSNPATVLIEDHSVQLTKTDEKTSDALAGAVFDLQDKDGNVVQSSLTTDVSGHILVENLPSGDYQFVETKAPDGYELDETPVTFTIERGQTETIQVGKTNKLILGSVTLTKTDDKSGAALQGAIFELQDKDGTVLQNNLTTDADGKLTIDNLEPGDYQLVETQAPEGYELDSTPVTFTIEKGQKDSVQVAMTNKLMTGSVVLTKTDEETNEVLQGAVFELQDKDGNVLQSGLTTNEEGQLSVDELVPGEYQLVETQAPTGYELDQTPVTFTIEKGQTKAVQVQMTNKVTPGSVILTKTDDKTGEVLQGAVFELQDKDGNVLQSGLITDESGKIAVNDLKPRDYQLVETQAPTGYELDQTPLTFTIEKGQMEAVQVQMTNKETPGSVILTKTDDKTGEVLQGAVFELQDKEGKVLQSNLITDETGKIVITDLAPGEYQLVETQAPTGYELDQTPVDVMIKKGQTEAIQVAKTNKLILGSVILTKIDATNGEVLQGAIFELQDEKGKTLQSNLTTDETGKIALTDLVPGNYQLVEVQAPTGYDLDATPVTFTVNKDSKEVIQLTKANQRTKGSITLQKVDDVSGQLLSGAVFELQDENHHVILKNMKTDESGKLTVEKLTPGTYYFVETQAPDGYQLDKTPLKFIVQGSKEKAQKITKVNKEQENTLRIVKKDNVNQTLLDGAVFTLYDGKGKIIQQNIKTNQAGVAVVGNLKAGEYTLKETKAPAGYQLDESPITITMDKKQNFVTVDVYNTQKKVSKNEEKPSIQPSSRYGKSENTYFPNTGVKNSLYLMIMGILIVILSIIWLVLKFVKGNKKNGI
ncbi:SpaA isopeptide-forming pilin-related protein [Enterococcus faecalis]|uniref:SpaA isopeptide-forming pilin-related protein n=2 Tax=Enterococcus faecalis TaxID=1351 RepID=UPI0001B2E92E|nr:SpaA isopeptide-forming pilin-related protein [Enterococcus faecalis]EEU80230.1 predicted protein [Enterococcus faecalis Fly1]EGO2630486.1 collagen binding domain-containing protein [Enterococcus faecalis]EGO7618579.1 collagen binding domain-containing protein [Enterococcus faecalis]EGO7913746.1 collagen binding domain-containing protein [Enterococcus faecalis]EHU8864334.1 collagen binding domain-containing protein [Enterococcus faecalis]